MVDAFHVLHPDGDVLLNLRYPDAAFAFWDEQPPEPDKLDSPRGERQLLTEGYASEVATPSHPESRSLTDDDVVLLEKPAEVQVQMRVSSSHLTLASPYFKRVIRGDWKEGHSIRSDGRLHLSLLDWDPDAVLILMNIIHGHTRSVPRSVSLEMLAKIAVLLDYYQCFEVAEVFTEMWLNRLEEELPATYSRDLILWIWISWVFRRPERFKVGTVTALKQCRGPIQTLGLPIPTSIVGR